MVFLSGFPLQPTKEKELPYPRNEGRPSFWRGCWAPAKPRSVQTAKGFAEIRNEQHKSLDKPPKRALRICSGDLLCFTCLSATLLRLLATCSSRNASRHATQSNATHFAYQRERHANSHKPRAQRVQEILGSAPLCPPKSETFGTLNRVAFIRPQVKQLAGNGKQDTKSVNQNHPDR